MSPILAEKQIAWEPSLEQARRRAVQEDKVVLIDFSAAPECSGCVAMDAVTYADSGVAQFIEDHCVPVRARVKDNWPLADEYLVRWTPNVVFVDADGKVHYRVVGYFHPTDFVAHLLLGVAKYDFNRMRFAEAAARYEEVADCHAGSDAAAEALYWLGVTRFKETDDRAQLNESWQRLARQYPDSDWRRRINIPGTS